ncbi:MAG TPA: hypothetical protein VFV69_01945 [Steroidobacteraceae bacterium]|jgi:hypothetical protein|nr:hypothetical protein [Steroidobacteraceae bacterium]
MRTYLSVIATAVLAACGGAQSPESGSSVVGVANADSSASAANAAAGAFANRKGELLNPDDSTIVFLYYDLAGLKPPITDWVEQDNRVQYAPGLDKAARRDAVKRELEAAAAAVRGMGMLRLSMNANLSEYDPTYSEFQVRALAPSSVVTYSALGQKVSLNFRNGRTAQIWRVPAAEAQTIRDKLGNYGANVGLDVLLRIAEVQPGPGGGTIVTDVLEYEMREQRTGMTIARVQVAQK